MGYEAKAFQGAALAALLNSRTYAMLVVRGIAAWTLVIKRWFGVDEYPVWQPKETT